MYRTVKRLLLLAILTSLKIAVILANSLHFSFLCICKVIVEIFQLPSTFLLADLTSIGYSSARNISYCSSQRVSTFVQTEEESSQLEVVGRDASTDVIIYNLNSTQKLVITQGKFKGNPCENCKSITEISSFEEVQDLTAATVGAEGSNISYMSIESDVLDSKIENGCSSSSVSSNEKESLKTFDREFSHRLVDVEESEDKTLNADNNNNISMKCENFVNARLNARNDTFSVSEIFENFECLKGNKSNDTYVKCNDMGLYTQKTSSPLQKLSQNTQSPSTNFSAFYDERQSLTENKNIRINNLDPWKNDTSVRDLKRRLSLPVKLNTSNTAVINFKLAQQKLIEDALKSTTRHEKSLKDIKYPFSSEISLESKHNEEDKEVFSCSSYESLPVSDHIRNAFENNALVTLYNENLHCEDKPDFSCVDSLVEAFNDIKSSLSVSNLAQSKITPSVVAKVADTKEKGLESLNESGNLKQSSCNGKSMRDRMLYECPKVSDSSRGTQCNFETGEKIPDFNFEVNVYKSLSEECKKLIKIEEIGIIKNKVNQTSTSSSPRKTMFSEAHEQTSDFENTVCLEDEVESNKSDSDANVPKIWQQSFHQIAFLDESNSSENSCKNQNILNTTCLNGDGKPMPVTESTSIGTSVELNKSGNYSNLSIPAMVKSSKSLEESQCEQMLSDLFEWTGTCKNAVLKLKDKEETRKSDGLSQVSLQNQKAFSDQNDTRETYRMNQNFSVKNYQDHSLIEDRKYKDEKIIPSDFLMKTNEFNNEKSILSVRQRSSHETCQSSPSEESSTKQNICIKKIQAYRPLNVDQKLRLCKKFLSSSSLKRKNSNDEDFLFRQSIGANGLSSNIGFGHEKNFTQKDILMTNRQERNPLNKYRKYMLFEENISSDDSASDNSEVTVKDLRVMAED